MIKAILDPKFQPMTKVVADYKTRVAAVGGTPLVIAVQRNKGYTATYCLDIFPNTIGVYFGNAIAYYAMFYDIKRVIIMGRVTSGEGGTILLARANEVLQK